MFFTIENYNRDSVQEEYIDHIVGSMDFLEARTMLKEYMLKEKDKLSNRELEREIRLLAPYILYGNFAEELVSTLEGDYHV